MEIGQSYTVHLRRDPILISRITYQGLYSLSGKTSYRQIS